MLVLSSAVVVTLVAVLAFTRWRIRSTLSDTCSLYAIEEAKITPPSRSKRQLLEARAMTNVRLESTFGFTSSTFVNASSDVHSVFTRRATTLLQRARDWTQMRTVARYACSRFVCNASSPFDEGIQCVTLATVFCTLFADEQHPITVEALARTDLICIAQGVNTLWNLSKSCAPDKSQDLSLLNEVNASIKRCLAADGDIVSRDDASHWALAVDENPLEFIVPALETLWRVVAVAYARAMENKQAFHSDPKAFIHEVLRLHPPTRRIARRWDDLTVRADVERAHCDTHVWGPTATTFDPTRTIRPLLAFGASPLRCPAATWAPDAVAVIVGALLESDLGLTRGSQMGGRDGWAGWSLTAGVSTISLGQ